MFESLIDFDAIREAVGLPEAISFAKLGPDRIEIGFFGKCFLIIELIRLNELISIPFDALTMNQRLVNVSYNFLRDVELYLVCRTTNKKTISVNTNNFQTNSLTISANGSEKIGGIAKDEFLTSEGQSATYVYVDGT